MIKKFASLFAFTLWSVSSMASIHSIDTVLMGSSFTFTGSASSPAEAIKGTNAGLQEVIRIENLISSWNSTSETHALNQNAGIAPVPVSKELYQLVYRCKKISKLSKGKFDITMAALHPVWKFPGTNSLPSDAVIAASIKLINYENIILDRINQTIYLTQPGMRISFGALGKGYAARMAKKAMKANGITDGVVNAGGDLTAWGTKENNAPWSVGIADPADKNNVLMWLDCSDQAVVTSGNYEKFATINGKKYGHIIDPTTGWPVNGLRSVTIICPNAELADALATAVFVMGAEDGLALINHLKHVECIMIDDHDRMITSDHLNTVTYAQQW